MSEHPSEKQIEERLLPRSLIELCVGNRDSESAKEGLAALAWYLHHHLTLARRYPDQWIAAIGMRFITITPSEAVSESRARRFDGKSRWIMMHLHSPAETHEFSAHSHIRLEARDVPDGFLLATLEIDIDPNVESPLFDDIAVINLDPPSDEEASAAQHSHKMPWPAPDHWSEASCEQHHLEQCYGHTGSYGGW